MTEVKAGRKKERTEMAEARKQVRNGLWSEMDFGVRWLSESLSNYTEDSGSEMTFTFA